MIQSTVADSLNLALTMLKRRRDSLGLRARILLAIHDAVLMCTPIEELKQVDTLLRECMSRDLEVPNVGLHYGVDIEVSFRWNEHMSPEEEAIVKDILGGNH